MPGNFHFFTQQILDDEAGFDAHETKHAILSLRYKKGDQISFTNGLGFLYRGEIRAIEKDNFRVSILEQQEQPRESELTMICGMIKSGDRMEWLVEKCTEFGVKAVFFVKCANSERGTVNTEKLKKTAIAALKQSHGVWLPEIAEISWANVLKQDGNKFIAAISGGKSLQGAWTGKDVFLVGPEGDFNQSEMEEAVKAGYQKISLGERILRTETAVLAIAANFAVRIL